MNIENYLKCHPYLAQLFKEIPTEELYHLQIRQYAPNQILIQKGGSVDDLFIILNGVCDVINELETGITICNYKISKLDIIGFAEIISDKSIRVATVTARTSTIVCVIPNEYVLKWFGFYPHFTKQLTHSILDKLHHSLVITAECKSYPLRVNIISYLIHNYELYRRNYIENYSGPIKILDSRQVISQFLGVDVRSINRMIDILKNESLINVVRGKIHITPPQYEALVEAKYIATQH